MDQRKQETANEAKGGSTMGFLRRLVFFLGVALGLVTLAAAGTVVLTYLFTGRLPSIEMAEGKAEVTLLTPDEVVILVREQVERAKKAHATEGAGGEGDG
jgi:hypothetical protein